MKLKKLLFLLFSGILLLSGCTSATNVTEKYFPKSYDKYGVSPNSGDGEFKFDTGEFALEVPKSGDPAAFVYLPITVNKVDTFEDHDVIRFDFNLEDSSFPDYNWSPHYEVGPDGDKSETFVKRIVDDQDEFVIKPILNNNGNEVYYLFPVDRIDKDRLKNLLTVEVYDDLYEMVKEVERYTIDKVNY